MANQIKVSKRFNSLKIGDSLTEGGKDYKVVGIDLLVNTTGGTDYILEETAMSRIKTRFFKRK